MSVHFLENDDEWATLLSENSLVVVDFSAVWCGPCKRIAPLFNTLSDVYSQYKFVKVDVDDCAGVAQECGVSAMPTFHVYANGNKVDELRGASEAGLKKLLEANKAAAE